ncbi:HTH-type transcriptional repressor RspR [Burkholderiales bacterium]|nr:HTH-type transcriptional repressor RspR [Burkholderiales bacterium]
MAARRQAAGNAEARICDAVRAAILERRLAPGTKLQEVALGEFFGVSRTIVRQALRRLDHEGIVALRDKRVAVVARPSADEVRHAFAARRVIEAAAVEAAVARAGKTAIAALGRLVRDEDAAYARGERGAGLTLSLEFHHRIGELSGNPVLARYARELVLQSSLAIALYEKSGDVRAHADHDALVDAIARRDGRRAARLMAAHVDELESRLELDGGRAPPTLAEIFRRDA